MDIYILYHGDTEEDTTRDINVFGKLTGKRFVTGIGYSIVMDIMDNWNENARDVILETIQIVTAKGNRMTVQEFLEMLISDKIKVNKIQHLDDIMKEKLKNWKLSVENSLR